MAFMEKIIRNVADLDASGLARAMRELEAIHEALGRAASYASLRFSTDTADPERGALLQRVQERGTEIETLLHTGRRVPRCECGAPLLRGSRFCPNCGRPLGQAEPAREDVSDETVVEPAPKH